MGLTYQQATEDFIGYDTEWNDLPWFQGKHSAAMEVARMVDEGAAIENIWPRPSHLYRAFNLTAVEDVRVIILGQDPYHTPGVANGLAFSTEPRQKLPPSLRNIFAELAEDTGIRNKSGFLRPWAYQGVLLLNTALTVVEGRAGSHSALWGGFAKQVFDFFNNRRQSVVFILWGRQAQQFTAGGVSGRHCTIMSPHPSPLSAHQGFFGSKPFSGANRFLKYNGLGEIDWRTSNGMVGPRGIKVPERPFRPIQGGISERILAARSAGGAGSARRERKTSDILADLDLGDFD